MEPTAMQGLTIHIDWQWFLGILGALIAIAWYSGGRFSAIETSIQWLKEAVNELKVNSENENTPAFGTHSPVRLNPNGEDWLVFSGLKNYIDSHKSELIKICEEKRITNPYEVQKHIFKSFDVLSFEPAFDDTLKKFAYERGITTSILRRVGAIYFRDICLNEFKMNKEDIDKHDPERQKT